MHNPDKIRTKDIAVLLQTAANALRQAVRIGSEIEDKDMVISGNGIKTLLGSMPTDLEDWARDLNQWYGRD